VPPHFLVTLPDAIDFETAQPMMLKGLTAQYLLRRTFQRPRRSNQFMYAAAARWPFIPDAVGQSSLGVANRIDRLRSPGGKPLHQITGRVAPQVDFARCVKARSNAGRPLACTRIV